MPLDVRGEVIGSAYVGDRVAGRERSTPPMIDVHKVRRRRGDFVSVVRGLDLRHGRPYVRVGGRFAGEVAGIELREGSVDVVGVERDAAPRSARRR